MPIDYQQLISSRSDGNEFQYDDRDVILYALGIGLGRDALDENELSYVFEGDQLRTVPTMASVLAPIPLLENCGYDKSQSLHGEHRLVLHRPLPPAAEIIADARVIDVRDKGSGRGAVIFSETTARLRGDNTLLFTQVGTTFARGDGGFGGPGGEGLAPHRVPGRAPDRMCVLETRKDQALLYRLNGDRNPLHVDPGTARRAGFARPIMHGLCTYGVACLAILKTICNYDHTLMTAFDVRFAAPVYPGETIITEMWREGDIVSFQCRVAERDQVVIRNGKCVLAG